MKDVLLTLLHLAVMTEKLCGPGGVRAVIAENLLLKQQLIVLRRARRRAPNLALSERLICAVGSLFLSPGRIRKVAIGLRLCVSNWEFSRRIQDSATLLGAPRLTYADPHMKDLLLVLLHLAVVTAKLCGSGGVRAVIAENLLLKQQLIVLRRARKRAPNLTSSDRLLCGFWSIFLSAGRIGKAGIALQPSTLLAFHQALVRR